MDDYYAALGGLCDRPQREASLASAGLRTSMRGEGADADLSAPSFAKWVFSRYIVDIPFLAHESRWLQRRREAIAALAGRLVECHSEFWSRASYGDEEVDEGRVSGRREDVEA